MKCNNNNMPERRGHALQAGHDGLTTTVNPNGSKRTVCAVAVLFAEIRPGATAANTKCIQKTNRVRLGGGGNMHAMPISETPTNTAVHASIAWPNSVTE